jgi:hypothetical protein
MKAAPSTELQQTAAAVSRQYSLGLHFSSDATAIGMQLSFLVDKFDCSHYTRDHYTKDFLYARNRRCSPLAHHQT